MSDNNISFDDLHNALLSADSMTEVAEAHGTLCGMICINGQADTNKWLALIFENQDPQNIQLEESRQTLLKLQEITQQKLTNHNYDLNLMIHADSMPLNIRIEDLSLWCQGFLFGLSIAGLTDISKLPTDASEILQDMSDISKAGYGAGEDDDEENEIAFSEIIEYVRMGVYVIFNTLNNNDNVSTSITVH